MKPAHLLAALPLLLLSACTTIQNRRDLYFPQTVEGPYTRMLKDGSWRKKQPTAPGAESESPADVSKPKDSKTVKPPVAG